MRDAAPVCFHHSHCAKSPCKRIRKHFGRHFNLNQHKIYINSYSEINVGLMSQWANWMYSQSRYIDLRPIQLDIFVCLMQQVGLHIVLVNLLFKNQEKEIK